jgi:Fe-S-cluster containining protein
MKRNVSVEEISDGRFYRASDLVKIGTGGCRNCHDCCSMGPVILLDPYDVYELERGLKEPFSQALDRTAELILSDGLILPALKMQTDAAGREKMLCPWLDGDGRCVIHAFRPGICRLYPLGRNWENGDFSYILQVGECTHCDGSKVKIKKWLGIPDLGSYEEFCRLWHSFLEKARQTADSLEADKISGGGTAEDGKLSGARRNSGQEAAAGAGADPGKAANYPAGSPVRRQICMDLLKRFYLTPWDTGASFYGQFRERLSEGLRALGYSG